MGVGVFSSTFMLFMGGLLGDGNGDGQHGGADGAGHGEVHVSFFSPLYLTSVMISMGALGIISLHGFHMEQRLSLAFSFVLSAILAYVISYFYISFFVKSQSSSLVINSSLIGLHAEVISVTGPTAPGQIAYVTSSGRQTRIAKTEESAEIPKGTTVEIVKIVGDTAIIKTVK